MYLSQINLNPLNRRVHRDLADCHELHRTIMRVFPDGHVDAAGAATAPRADLGVLYRIDINRRRGSVVALIQSAAMPDWGSLASGYLLSDPSGLPDATTKPVDHIYAGIQPGQDFVFRLRANPTKRIHRQIALDGKVWDGKRVELRREEDWHAWIRRKAEHGGFALATVQAAPAASNEIVVPNVAVGPSGRVVSRRHRLTFGAVLFEGRLRVTDADRFRTTLAYGIGSGKAYGFGLLSIAPGR